MIVCIDPGHGGHDSGAHVAGRRPEKEVVLMFGLSLRPVLQIMGARVVMTRDRDEFIPLSRRAEIANEAKSDCMVSIHINAASSSHANGAWVIYDDAGDGRGRDLAELIWKNVAAIPGMADADEAREVYPDGSPWVGNRQLTVISKSRMPAVLVELGFLTNDGDYGQLDDPDMIGPVCRAISEAIIEWGSGL